ncbi:hypothetical protein MPSEU_000168200 [Mayamaea pseudoterrestris]|nr:hypothetical protein MPSEU_000168200 [Mayamaea pseudoterrestris]
MNSSPIPEVKPCHILPCNIDFTGALPDDGRLVYFQPQPLKLSAVDGGDQIYAAQFRGRGLLAKAISTSGQVVMVTDNKFRKVSAFDKVFEWQHAHQPSAVVTSSSRMGKIMEWYEVSSALHAPVDTRE